MKPKTKYWLTVYVGLFSMIIGIGFNVGLSYLQAPLLLLYMKNNPEPITDNAKYTAFQQR